MEGKVWPGRNPISFRNLHWNTLRFPKNFAFPGPKNLGGLYLAWKQERVVPVPILGKQKDVGHYGPEYWVGKAPFLTFGEVYRVVAIFFTTGKKVTGPKAIKKTGPYFSRRNWLINGISGVLLLGNWGNFFDFKKHGIRGYKHWFPRKIFTSYMGRVNPVLKGVLGHNGEFWAKHVGGAHKEI